MTGRARQIVLIAVAIFAYHTFFWLQPTSWNDELVGGTFGTIRIDNFLPSPRDPINVTVWYPRDSAWEQQYIPEHLIQPAALGHITMRIISTVPEVGWSRTSNDSMIVDPYAVNILVIHGHIDDDTRCHSTVVEKVQYYQPAVVFIVSDEAGNTRRCTTEKLSRLVPLVFRGFSSQSFGIPVFPNVFNTPLGHMTGQQYPPRSALRRASLRDISFAFVGWDKHERKYMLELLSGRFNRSIIEFGTKASAQAVVDAYVQAVFVPNTKGFITYDCFRQYEASRTGAIPVIVGPAEDDDLKFRTFGYFVGWEGRMPPWIFATNWTMAADIMEGLLADKVKLDARQKAVLDWWDTVIAATRGKIRRVLEADFARRSSARHLAQQFDRIGRSDVAALIDRVPSPIAVKPPA